MQTRADTRSCVHYASTYLPLTENWIYRILIHHRAYKPVFLARKKANLTLFPIQSLHSLDDYGLVRRLAEIAFFKLTGYFHLFLRVSKKHEARILHVHFGYHAVKSIGLKRKLDVPIICSFYGDDVFARPHVGNNLRRYQRMFKSLDKALVLGPYMRAELVRLGCPAEKIMVHHLGIDAEAIQFAQRNVKAGEKIRFLIASSFLPKKGIDLALRALSALRDAFDFSLDIVGDGPLKNELLAEIRNGGLADRVTLHGYRPYPYFIELAYQCHVFIQASRTTEANNKEGTPMAIVDAMATGMAIVSTRHSDIPEIVFDGVHGYLAAENDVASLTQCLRQIFEHPERIASFSQQARARVEQEFNARIQTARLEEIYDALIAASASR